MLRQVVEATNYSPIFYPDQKLGEFNSGFLHPFLKREEHFVGIKYVESIFCLEMSEYRGKPRLREFAVRGVRLKFIILDRNMSICISDEVLL